MSRRQSFFGTVETGRVYFNIRLDDRDGGQVPDWDLPINAHDHVIPYADPPRSEEEIVSVDPCFVTWRLHLASREDYRALRAKLGTTDTLWVIAGLQSQGEAIQVDGDTYDELPLTTLRRLERPAFSVDDRNGCEVDVTFRRHIDPTTGEAVSS